MGRIRELKKHLTQTFDINKYSLDDYLKCWINDVLCAAEHEMMGSTHIQVDNPWIPYALLSGDSVNLVNQKRAQLNIDKRQGVAIGFYFDLYPTYIVFYEHQPVNPKTLEIGMPKIIEVKDAGCEIVIPKSEWQNAKYTGEYQRKS